MKKELLKDICKKTFLKNLERDLKAVGIPVIAAQMDFITNSFKRSREFCRVLLEELSNCEDFFFFLEQDEINAIVDDAYVEMQCAPINW
ncbi:hypothetical protein [Robertkochia flava]|uniref:hypothetical protein n=1 Tax=Robertkochia flava TaxID=3447986 RepID=UPI001CCF8529|nr:hypothetical protein [Robertkochia marina]